MTDEAGGDDKVLCVPAADPRWEHIQDIDDVPEFDRLEIEHFFSVYKDLEPGKSVEGAELGRPRRGRAGGHRLLRPAARGRAARGPRRRRGRPTRGLTGDRDGAWRRSAGQAGQEGVDGPDRLGVRLDPADDVTGDHQGVVGAGHLEHVAAAGCEVAGDVGVPRDVVRAAADQPLRCRVGGDRVGAARHLQQRGEPDRGEAALGGQRSGVRPERLGDQDDAPAVRQLRLDLLRTQAVVCSSDSYGGGSHQTCRTDQPCWSRAKPAKNVSGAAGG